MPLRLTPHIGAGCPSLRLWHCSLSEGSPVSLCMRLHSSSKMPAHVLFLGCLPLQVSAILHDLLTLKPLNQPKFRRPPCCWLLPGPRMLWLLGQPDDRPSCPATSRVSFPNCSGASSFQGLPVTASAELTGSSCTKLTTWSWFASPSLMYPDAHMWLLPSQSYLLVLQDHIWAPPPPRPSTVHPDIHHIPEHLMKLSGYT